MGFLGRVTKSSKYRFTFYFTPVSHFFPFFKACFLWFSIQFSSFCNASRKKKLLFLLKKKEKKFQRLKSVLRYHFFIQRQSSEKFLHEKAINKQMDRNNHRMENFTLSWKIQKSQVSNFVRTEEISCRESFGEFSLQGM